MDRSPRGQLAADARAAVRATAEGNPLFIEQCLAGITDGANASESKGPPHHVRALIAARLDGLGPVERTVVERACVIGRDFSRLEVEALLPSPARASLGSVLQSLVHKLLIRRSGAIGGAAEFSFRHGLTRETAYQATTKGQRAELHERFATWLEQHLGDDAAAYQEILGHHLERAHHCRRETGRLNRHTEEAERAAAKLAAAGVHAFGYGDLNSAVGLLRRALDLETDPQCRVAVLTEMIST